MTDIKPMFAADADAIAGKAAQREARRVQTMLSRDAEDRHADDVRRDAAMQLANGGEPLPEHLAVPPTREWGQHGEFVETLGIREHWTKRPARTVRRVEACRAVQLHRRGVIDEDGLKACIWYRNTFERAQLGGKVGIANYSGVRSTGAPPVGHLAASEEEYQARADYHAAKSALPVRLRWVFEAVALSDLSLTKAAAVGRFRKHSGLVAFKAGVRILAAFLASKQEVLGEE